MRRISRALIGGGLIAATIGAAGWLTATPVRAGSPSADSGTVQDRERHGSGQDPGSLLERTQRPPWSPDPRWGAYSTQALDAVASERRAAGWNADRIARALYAPFPVGGPSTWGDTWGAPRHAGGYHPHHGQDLSCTEGTPLIAVARGVIRLTRDPLGGLAVRIILPDGGYWYYAHLAAWPSLVDGARVRRGSIVGTCGQTGDATAPHLHIALFRDGNAIDPMASLVRWLGEAARRAGSEGTGPRTLPEATTPTGPPEPASDRDPQPPAVLAVARPAIVAVTPDPFEAGAMSLAVGSIALALAFASRRVRRWILRVVAGTEN